jgi:hypothetical protein
MKSVLGEVTTIIAMIIGVAILAVIVSPRAQTSQVVTSGGNALTGILNAALSPVVGTGGFNIGRGAGLGNSVM